MTYIVLLVFLLLLGRLAVAIIRFVLLPRAAKRNYPIALWARLRWRWLARNLGLAYPDAHRRRANPVSYAKPGTSVRTRQSESSPGTATLRYPRARFRPDEFGIIAKVRTVPRVDRVALEKNADHIANAWRCVRVQVSQPKPGRLILRGLRTDPLLVPYPASDMPAEVLAAPRPGDLAELRLYLGRDEWGAHRWAPLPGVTGITVGGLPGFGKTEFIKLLLRQLRRWPVHLVIIDGKGSFDYADVPADVVTGDELPAAAEALEGAHQMMRDRLATAPGNAWHTGPTGAMPIALTIVDECHTFFDLESVKGDREAESLVRSCRHYSGQLVKKGRSVLHLTVFITQKQTGDAIPTPIRDNCRLGVSFAVKTRDAAVAALGEHIRDYPGSCPSGLQDPAYVGVLTASLRTGTDPFVRLRVPELTGHAARQREHERAGVS